MELAGFLFYFLAAVSTVSAVAVVTSRHPLYSALFLVIALFALAGIFLLLEAYFLAAVQVIVYAGAIVVLFIFVIMLLNLGAAQRFLKISEPRVLVGIGVAVVFAAEVIAAVRMAAAGGGEGLSVEVSRGEAVGGAYSVGEALFTKYLFPFEVASLLLLVALVGAVILAKRELK